MTGRTTDWLHKSNYTGLEDSVHEQIMSLQDSMGQKYRVLINTAKFCALAKKKKHQKIPQKPAPKTAAK